MYPSNNSSLYLSGDQSLHIKGRRYIVSVILRIWHCSIVAKFWDSAIVALTANIKG